MTVVGITNNCIVISVILIYRGRNLCSICLTGIWLLVTTLAPPCSYLLSPSLVAIAILMVTVLLIAIGIVVAAVVAPLPPLRPAVVATLTPLSPAIITTWWVVIVVGVSDYMGTKKSIEGLT